MTRLRYKIHTGSYNQDNSKYRKNMLFTTIKTIKPRNDSSKDSEIHKNNP